MLYRLAEDDNEEMYDIEEKMQINYTIEQEYDYEYDVTIEDFINEEVDEYGDCIEEGSCDCSYGPYCRTCGYSDCDQSC